MEGASCTLDMIILSMMDFGKILVAIMIIALGLEVIFGDEPAQKNDRSSTTKRDGAVCDQDAVDEDDRRFVQEMVRTHEDNVRLQDAAAKEAWDAHVVACDQHEAAMDMHNDLCSSGCDPWF